MRDSGRTLSLMAAMTGLAMAGESITFRRGPDDDEEMRRLRDLGKPRYQGVGARRERVMAPYEPSNPTIANECLREAEAKRERKAAKLRASMGEG